MHALVMPFMVMYWGVCEYALTAEALRGVFDRQVLEVTQYVLIAYGTVWTSLMGFTYLLIRRGDEGTEALAHVTVQLYALPNLYAAYLLGPVTSPFLVVLLGSGLLGLLIFPPRVAWAAVASASMGLVVPELLRLVGLIPYAPLLHSSPHDDPRVTHFWSALMWFIVVSVSTLLFSLFYYLVRELRAREDTLRTLSRTDPLTELYNRRHFMEHLHQEHSRALRYGRPLSCIMIDLDHFKRINDAHGHATGDAVLRETARRLSQALRNTDLVARLGGEEFGAVLPDTDLDGARRVAERCRELLDASPMCVADGQGVRVTASFGVAVLDPEHSSSADALLRAADAALYVSKGEGRNRVSLAGDGVGALAVEAG